MTFIEYNDNIDINSIINDNRLVIIFAYGKWCPMCKMLKPQLYEFAEANNITLISIDSEKYKKINSLYNISNLPTLIWIDSRKIVESISGKLDYEDLEYTRDKLAFL